MEQELSTGRQADRGCQGGGREAVAGRPGLSRGRAGERREAGWGDALETGRGSSGEAPGPGLEAQVVTALEADAGRIPTWMHLLPLGEVPLGTTGSPCGWTRRPSRPWWPTSGAGTGSGGGLRAPDPLGRKAPAAGWIRS